MISRIARFSLATLVSAAIGLSSISAMAADSSTAAAPDVAPTDKAVAKKTKKEKKAEKKTKKKSKKRAKATEPAA